MTVTHPACQPAGHVAIASTRYAYLRRAVKTAAVKYHVDGMTSTRARDEREWTRQGVMPRAFLVKNKMRCPAAAVDDDNTSQTDINSGRDLGGLDNGERPSQPQYSDSRCSQCHEKNGRTIELTHPLQPDVTQADRSEG